MTTINPTTSALDMNRQAAGLQGANRLREMQKTPEATPEQVRDAFTQFVGESFYAQMLKAMRSSLAKPAYFHGGRAEEIFTAQLDQTMAQQLADKSTERLIDPLFERQFPWLAEQLRESSAGNSPTDSSTRNITEVRQ
jgi:Rod binding domain-containing protein